MKLLSFSICIVVILIIFFSYLAYKNFKGGSKNEKDFEEIKKITSKKRNYNSLKSKIVDKPKEKENIVHYYNTNYRSPKHEIGILWNDPLLKIKWPIKKPILSKKDKINLTLKQFYFY